MYIVLFDNNKCIIFSIKIRNIFYCFQNLYFKTRDTISYKTKNHLLYYSPILSANIKKKYLCL